MGSIITQAVLWGSVYMIYADVSSDERPPGAAGRLLTSSTTKLSSLLSASLPCEGRERESEIRCLHRDYEWKCTTGALTGKLTTSALPYGKRRGNLDT